jgi:hypothetical protein
MIRTCNCECDFQDKRYGEKMRVHNTSTVGKPESRCTRCGSVKSQDPSASIKAK